MHRGRGTERRQQRVPLAFGFGLTDHNELGNRPGEERRRGMLEAAALQILERGRDNVAGKRSLDRLDSPHDRVIPADHGDRGGRAPASVAAMRR